jgi:hypothetical protein
VLRPENDSVASKIAAVGNGAGKGSIVMSGRSTEMLIAIYSQPVITTEVSSGAEKSNVFKTFVFKFKQLNSGTYYRKPEI